MYFILDEVELENHIEKNKKKNKLEKNFHRTKPIA